MAYTALSAAASTGAGTTIVIPGGATTWTVQLLHTGSPTSVIVDFEGTLDGTNWLTFRTHTMASSNDEFVLTPVALVTVRLNITALSGGSTPTVTGWIEPGGRSGCS